MTPIPQVKSKFRTSVLLTGFLFNDLKKEFAKEREKIVSV